DSLEVTPGTLHVDGGRALNSVDVVFQVSDRVGLASYAVAIAPVGGAVVRQLMMGPLTGTMQNGRAPFDGRDDRGMLVAPGMYEAQLGVRDTGGMGPVMQSARFMVVAGPLPGMDGGGSRDGGGLTDGAGGDAGG